MSPPAKPAPDDAMLRTLFLGMLGGFVLYAIGLALMFLVGDTVGFWLSTIFTVAGLVFVLGWWYATVRKGFRVGKGPNKREVRAKEKQRAEKEKLRALRMRR